MFDVLKRFIDRLTTWITNRNKPLIPEKTEQEKIEDALKASRQRPGLTVTEWGRKWLEEGYQIDPEDANSWSRSFVDADGNPTGRPEGNGPASQRFLQFNEEGTLHPGCTTNQVQRATNFVSLAEWQKTSTRAIAVWMVGANCVDKSTPPTQGSDGGLTVNLLPGCKTPWPC